MHHNIEFMNKAEIINDKKSN